MGGKTKQTKKFNKKHLNHTLVSRKKHQEKVKLAQNKQHKRSQIKNQKSKNHQKQKEDNDDDSVTETKPKLDMSLDALLNPRENSHYSNQSDEEKDEQDQNQEEEEEEEEEEEDDDDLESIDSLEDGSNQKIDFKMLKEKDPEFYSFLEKNDKGLLEFNQDEQFEDGDDDDDDNESHEKQKGKPTVEDEETHSTLLTKELLRNWQKAILENKSMRALRKVLLAFKSAAFSSSQDSRSLPFLIESSSVYNAVITTALRFLPFFLNHTLPAKELPNGKFKTATNSKIYASMQRMLKSYFTSLIELIKQVPSQQQPSTDDSSVINNSTTKNNNDMLQTAVNQSSKLIPWITGNRKIMKSWIKTLLELWASSSDSVRLAAILSLRKLALAADTSTTESVMKGVYTTLIRSCKNTTVFSLPLINLMKNSGANIYLINLDLAYPIVFSYIRQLAIHLRNSMKLKTKEGFQAVYNWQYIHSLDFWSLVLSSACSKEKLNSKEKSNYKSKSGSTSALEPLIFPLVQITIGVIKLVPTTRYYPLRFHCLRLLLRLIQQTETFIPLTPFLLEPLDSPLFKRSPTPTNNNIKPLDFEYIIRCPKSHEHSRVYVEGVTDELVFLLLQYHASLAHSYSFPELVLPGSFILKKFIKNFSSLNLNSFNKQKIINQIKTLVQKIESHQDWIKVKRNASSSGIMQDLKFDDLDALNKSPLISHFILQSKIRKQKQSALDRSAHNDIQID